MTSPAPSSAQTQDPSLDQPHPSTSTTTPSAAHDATPGGQSAATTAAAAELASAKLRLHDALRHYPDFPIKGVDFIDIMPLFSDPAIHATLVRALELQALDFFASSSLSSPAAAAAAAASPVDVVVGLDARGFLFGPSLALKLGAGFAPIRKKGKLPGPCVTASYEKEYGADYFQIQEGAIKPGQKVLVVDDIIATGGSAAAAAELVKKLGGELIGYLFILEISFLKGREKLGAAPVITLLEESD